VAATGVEACEEGTEAGSSVGDIDPPRAGDCSAAVAIAVVPDVATQPPLVRAGAAVPPDPQWFSAAASLDP